MDRDTIDVYEHNVDAWIEHRRRSVPATLDVFARRAPAGPRADLGCGPGWHSGALGDAVVAMDAAAAMTARVREFAPNAWPIVGDLERLPFRRGGLAGAWAHKSYMHLRADHVPLALAEVHRALQLGGALHVQVTSDRQHENADDRFPGRHFEWWPAQRLRDVIEGAGFTIDSFVDDGEEWIDVEATRARRLADTVGPNMRLLIVGLNPSEYAADAGVGFARPGNRFWPAALASGLVSRPHDPHHALVHDRVGMTDLVKRATPRADALRADEYREGASRVERLVRWLEPRAVCFVGLTGYRAAVGAKAVAGWQPEAFGGRPAYVMPNPSGLNAHTNPAELASHLRAALSG
ncbi:MAG TPA: uracil-DNA glycosylase family protein [Acidimicrobiia bacterium]|nr:uracil-DNA glycosylase family protein [Acidimicrobiia bacterium]